MQPGIILTPAQRAVVDGVKAGGSVLVTGAARTGKTTLTQAVAAEMEAAGVRVDKRPWGNLLCCLGNDVIQRAQLLIVTGIPATVSVSDILEVLRDIRRAGGVFTQTVLEFQGPALDVAELGWLELVSITHTNLVDMFHAEGAAVEAGAGAGGPEAIAAH